VEYWLLGGAALALALLAPRLRGGRGVTAGVVKQKLEAGATVVDVRSPGEFRAGAYPGALNIPLQAVGARLAEIPRDRPVVLYCASGARSGAAEKLLRQAGYEDVVNAGGLASMPR
jgi:phage shock protein E